MNHFRNDMDAPTMTRNELHDLIDEFRQVYVEDNSGAFVEGYLQSMLVSFLLDADSYTRQDAVNRIRSMTQGALKPIG